ncbi:hypothetical protein LTR84_005420 [Exophiala bonariae]|uniref:MaoC-like domain-containing protein n=1 Tax=Exophiala bonariae TaxID=1690606 RepID=A0AAV9N3T2_9EURO|nr:hypothetical protein LTR84_005420 [Exophiala bonariae]
MYACSRIRPQFSRQIRHYAHTTASSSIKQDTETTNRESETGQSPCPDSEDERSRHAFLAGICSPEPRALGNVYAQWSPNIHRLHGLLQEHLHTPYPRELVPPGYHQVSHKKVSRQWLLDEDGAELKHAPGPEYKFRVWSGGTMQFSRPFIPWRLTELLASERFESCKKYPFGARVSIVQDFEIPRGVHELPPAFEPGHDTVGPIIREHKRLAFFTEIPPSLKTKDNMVGATARPVPPGSLAREVVLPTPAMLFYFSALTLNAHAIHLDREFTKSVYGIPDLLVHGPLTSLLMLELLRKKFSRLGIERESDYFIKHFKYNNHRPLWVNEEITIGCKKIGGESHSSGTQFPLSDRELQTNSRREVWYVWISKGTGDKETIAVDGIAIVSKTPHSESPLQKWRSTRGEGKNFETRQHVQDTHPRNGIITKEAEVTSPISPSRNSDASDPVSSDSENEPHPKIRDLEIPSPSENPLESTTSTVEGEPLQKTQIPPPVSETFNSAPMSPSKEEVTKTDSPPVISHEVRIHRMLTRPREKFKSKSDPGSQSQTPSSSNAGRFRIRHIAAERSERASPAPEPALNEDGSSVLNIRYVDGVTESPYEPRAVVQRVAGAGAPPSSEGEAKQ